MAADGVLTKTEWARDDPPAPLKFDRRTSGRTPAIGDLRAVRYDAFGASHPLAIRLIDESVGGLCADTQVPVPPGSRLEVCTAPERNGWRSGRVVRCMPTGRGYRIGFAYELRRAA